jgi:hypothetical protein
VLPFQLLLLEKIRCSTYPLECLSLLLELGYLLLELLGKSLPPLALSQELLLKDLDHGFLLSECLTDQLVKLHVNLASSFEELRFYASIVHHHERIILAWPPGLRLCWVIISLKGSEHLILVESNLTWLNLDDAFCTWGITLS